MCNTCKINTDHTSSSRRRCSFCSSMRFCRSCNSCRLCSSGSLRWAASWACCLLWASERSLFSCWRRWKSLLKVDSPGTLRIELTINADDMNKTIMGTIIHNYLQPIQHKLQTNEITSTLCHLHGFHPLHHYHCTRTLFPLEENIWIKSNNTLKYVCGFLERQYF